MRTRKGVNTEVEAGERKTRIASVIETLLWVAAALCLFPLIATSVARPVLSQLATQHAPPAPEVQDSGPAETANPTPRLISDTADWSPQRLGALERLRASLAPDTQGTLLLPRQGAQIPIFSGTGEVSMTLGAGHLLDSAPLDSDGNIALSAHRDGSFRVLREIEAGDPLVLNVNGRERTYIVSDLTVVEPGQLDVLDPTPVPTVTLITCYPFHFVGNAPWRYIVRAELESSPADRAMLSAGISMEADSVPPESPATFTER